MRTRRLVDHQISVIGGGGISPATSAARGIPARDASAATVEAIALGITLFDTADADGEQLAGQAVRDQRARDRVIIATRVANLAPPPGPPRDLLRERLPMAYLQDRVEAALRTTRLDALPLVQLALRPAWLDQPAWPELVGTCARLVREGKVIAWAAWLDEPDEAAAPLLAETWLAAASVVYNACDRRAEAIFAAADQRELPILVRQPLAGGALTGNLGPGVHLTPRDDRNAIADATLERIAIAVAKLSALVKRAAPAASANEAARATYERATRNRPEHLECFDVAELALRFAIDRAGRHSIALPRLHRRDHLPFAIAAASAPPLSADLLNRIVDDLADI